MKSQAKDAKVILTIRDCNGFTLYVYMTDPRIYYRKGSRTQCVMQNNNAHKFKVNRGLLTKQKMAFCFGDFSGVSKSEHRVADPHQRVGG